MEPLIPAFWKSQPKGPAFQSWQIRQHDGAPLRTVTRPGFRLLLGSSAPLLPAPAYSYPALRTIVCPNLPRQDERQGFIVGIEQHVKAVVDDPFAANIRTVNAFPIEKNSESFGKSLAPLFFSHLQSVRRKPADIRDFCTVNGTALKPLAPSEDGVLLAQLNQPVREFQQFLIRRFPVKPRDFIVLTIGVIVTPLGAADLISAEQHRDALRQKQRG